MNNRGIKTCNCANADISARRTKNTTGLNGIASKWMERKGALALSFGLLVMGSAPLTAQVNVSFSATAPTSLQDEFVAEATRQYHGALTKSPFFANTYSLTITGKKGETVTPTSVTLTSTGTYVVKIGPDTKMVYQSTASISQIYVYGFSDGMELERSDIKRLIAGLKDDVYRTGTCGGLIAATTAAAEAFVNGCSTAYNIATSTITQRDGMAPAMILK